MFQFFKRKKKDATNCNEDATKIATGYVSTQVIQTQVQQASKTYAKPDTYTNNRTLYDSGVAKRTYKTNLFNNSKEVYDPYTGSRLVLTKKEAKALYGKDWANHLAESDHVKPLEQIYNDTRNNVWNTTDDIKAAANSDANMRAVSRKFNNAKRSRTNQEFVEDELYLQKTGVNLSESGKQQALRDSELAEKAINRQLNTKAVKNMLSTGHEAGLATAKSAGTMTTTMSGISNLVAVIKGEKECDEAIADTLKNGGKATLTGYAMGNSMTVLSHSLSKSSSQFIQSLVKSNVPGQIVTSVMVTGDTLRKWGEGEITTQQCILELGDKGLNMATAGYSMAVGQALIPIPVIGGAIGALVGSALTSGYYRQLISTLQVNELEHQERMRIIAECKMVAEQTKAYRTELEAYLDNYFKEYKSCFDDAITSMKFAYQVGDADGMIASANQITRKLGGRVYYDTVEEFKQFLDSDIVDIL